MLIRNVAQAVIDGTRKNVKRIFDTSQRLVPVRTGRLKNSGRIKQTSSGADISYNTPYAAKMEFGQEAQDFSNERHVIKVKATTRKSYVTKEGTMVKAAVVPAHERIVFGRYISLNPFTGKPDIRLIQKTKAFEGRHFVGNAVKQEIQHLSEDIEFFVKKIDGRL